jgi:serine/threonine protein kinase
MNEDDDERPIRSQPRADAPADPYGTVNTTPATSVEFPQVLQKILATLPEGQQDLFATDAHTSLRPKQARKTTSASIHSVRARSVRASADVSSEDGGDLASNQAADYLTLGLLGAGGMGTVFLARQAALGRSVALKQINRSHQHDNLSQVDFLTEAVLTGKLEHPNIVPIYEVGKSPDGALFYSMKNIKGKAWSESMQTLSLDENLNILLDVCDAMAFAHAQGVIHRDLKPTNIMTGGFGEVLVLDWGLALQIGAENSIEASFGGTPAFMAPEMVNPPFRVGRFSDIYFMQP